MTSADQPLHTPDAAAIKEAADSVFRYVERTAEPVQGGIRWRTLNYENKPYYDASVFNGVGGIPLFLADYYRLTENERALELALGGVRWATAHPLGSDSGDGTPDLSLCFGQTGVGMAWLRLAQVSGSDDFLVEPVRLAERLREAELSLVTDFIGGEAGIGVFLLRLWETTKDLKHLAQAIRRAEWLAEKVIRDEHGTRWLWHLAQPGAKSMIGFAHGVTGIAHFVLLLYQATSDSRWAELAREVAETVAGAASEGSGRLKNGNPCEGVNWRWALEVPANPTLCQWCHGAPGVGMFFAKAYEALGELRYLALATAAGETTFLAGDTRKNATQCHGLAGNAELFVELYRLISRTQGGEGGGRAWLNKAHDFAARCLTYRTESPSSDTWQADDPGYDSPDFMCGASGTGHFFLRLLTPDDIRMPLQ